jgi:hypothetical protein
MCGQCSEFHPKMLGCVKSHAALNQFVRASFSAVIAVACHLSLPQAFNCVDMHRPAKKFPNIAIQARQVEPERAAGCDGFKLRR